MDENIETKLCKTCKAEKAITEFRFNQKKEKLNDHCVDCVRERNRISNENYKNKFKNTGKKYFDATKNEFIEYYNNFLNVKKHSSSRNI